VRKHTRDIGRRQIVEQAGERADAFGFLAHDAVDADGRDAGGLREIDRADRGIGSLGFPADADAQAEVMHARIGDFARSDIVLERGKQLSPLLRRPLAVQRELDEGRQHAPCRPAS
jgi:hypothetical protein